jgi:hypothetical protein
MRFPSKHSFVRASLLFVFVVPTPAFADVASTVAASALAAASAAVEPAAETAGSPERFLNLSEAQKAFGPEFSTKEVDGTVILFGGTTKECMENFDVSNDPNNGTFKIFYKGGNDTCLSHTDAVKDIARGAYQGLDSLPDGRMKATGTFDRVDLVWENLTSSKSPFASVEIPVDADGASIAHLSAADAEALRAKKEHEKKQGEADFDMLLVTKCHRGLDELDVGEEALERLLQVPELLGENKDEKWLSDTAAKFRAEKFAACRKQILKARTDEIASASCEDRLAKIVAEDPEYAPKVKALYLDLVKRYMDSQAMGVEEAFTAATDTLEKIRGFDLGEKEEAELAVLERNLHLRFLQRASLEGADSESFKAMRSNMLDYLAESDTLGCLTDGGAISPQQARNPGCASAQWLSMQFGQQIGIAQGVQAQLNKKAQELADTQGCQVLRSNSALSGSPLSAADEAKCKAIEYAADAKLKATVNAGITGNGFGEAVSTPTDASWSTPTTQTTNSGLMNSAYTAPQTTTQVAPQTAPQAQVAPAPANTVAAGQPRIFH